jgi:hypothetical protein
MKSASAMEAAAAMLRVTGVAIPAIARAVTNAKRSFFM